MTLLELINAIEGVASSQPSVNMIVRNDIFRLNAVAEARYGVFAWLQGGHSASVDTNLISYSFTFFYVDRLTENQSNQIEIQSVGIQTLDNIIRKLDDLGIYAEQSYTFQAFNQRFLDECAGVFCNITLSVPAGSACPEDFGAVTLDGDVDYLVY